MVALLQEQGRWLDLIGMEDDEMVQLVVLVGYFLL